MGKEVPFRGGRRRGRWHRGSLESRITKPQAGSGHTTPLSRSGFVAYTGSRAGYRNRGTWRSPAAEPRRTADLYPDPRESRTTDLFPSPRESRTADLFPNPRESRTADLFPDPRESKRYVTTRRSPAAAPRDEIMTDIPCEPKFATREDTTCQFIPLAYKNDLEWNPNTNPAYVEGVKTLHNLETGVKQGLYHLRELKEALRRYTSSRTLRWLEEIREVEQKAQLSQRFVIGVTGETGAGKSSLINALLDEERLVPTNSMRASTATVVEIAYNYGELRYRAEVEFISQSEWKRYLEILFGDIRDGDGTTMAVGEEYTVACAMIKAVYGIQAEDIEKHTVAELADHEHLRGILGHVKSFAHDDPNQFHTQLQIYVDSASRVKLAYWPLIRVVRVYVKAPVLQTGAVIADLPGVQDSNPARAEVATRYLKECSRIWVVTPVVRAVDNKTAKNLLGTAFRRQLQMDGSYELVTFICSKTDDISFTEAAQVPGIGRQQIEMRSILNNQEACITSLEAEKKALHGQRDQVNESLDKTVKDIMHLSDAAGHLGDGTARERLCAAKEQMESLFKHKSIIEQKITALEAEMKSKLHFRNSLIWDMEASCVKARNWNVKEAMREHFAEGLQEIHFDESHLAVVPTLDYKGTADAVPVFCVSAKAYQQLRGRMGNDPRLRGFRNVGDTELPQLREHCIGCTVSPRQRSCSAFLTSFQSLLNSISITLTSGSFLPLEAIREDDRKYLQSKLEELKAVGILICSDL